MNYDKFLFRYNINDIFLMSNAVVKEEPGVQRRQRGAHQQADQARTRPGIQWS